MNYNNVFGFHIFDDTKDNEPRFFAPDAPSLLDGGDIYDSICPINTFTGHRDNPLSILQYALSPANQRMLDVILAELPAIKEMECSDDVKLDMLVSRLDTGTFAERDIVMKRLEKISDILFESKPEVKDSVTDVKSPVTPVKDAVTDSIKSVSSDSNPVSNDK